MQQLAYLVMVLLVTMLTTTSPAQAMVCEELFQVRPGPLSEDSRLRQASFLMRRTLTTPAIDGIRAAHAVGFNEKGKNGLPAASGNYTWRQIRKKAQYLTNAGFTKSEIRILMENRIVGGVDQALIMAAMQAELSAPTATVVIRQSGSLEQYHRLDSPDWIGKHIMVKLIEDIDLPGRQDGHEVRQLILTKDYLDPASQSLVEALKLESGLNPFREVGAWILYTERGVYESNRFTSNDPFMLANDIVSGAFEDAYLKMKQAEGPNAKVQDVEFFHTHFEPGEAFSHGDRDHQADYFRRRISQILAPGGTYAAYAVPVQGRALFRSAIRVP